MINDKIGIKTTELIPGADCTDLNNGMYECFIENTSSGGVSELIFSIYHNFINTFWFLDSILLILIGFLSAFAFIKGNKNNKTIKKLIYVTIGFLIIVLFLGINSIGPFIKSLKTVSNNSTIEIESNNEIIDKIKTDEVITNISNTGTLIIKQGELFTINLGDRGCDEGYPKLLNHDNKYFVARNEGNEKDIENFIKNDKVENYSGHYYPFSFIVETNLDNLEQVNNYIGEKTNGHCKVNENEEGYLDVIDLMHDGIGPGYCSYKDYLYKKNTLISIFYGQEYFCKGDDLILKSLKVK